MPRFLYVCVRPQREAAAAEHESFHLGTRLADGELDRLDLVRERLPEDAFDRWDGFLIGGSPFNVTDPESAKTPAQLALEADLEAIASRAASGGTAALFTCYGIGIVTRMLGGTVSRAHPEDTGPTTIELTPAGERDAVFGGLAHRFSALTAHKEGADELPAGAVLLARNDACPIQAYAIGDWLYATQFHPEPTVAAFTERMAVYRDDGYFDSGDFDAIAARVRAASITEPPRILRAFVDLVARR